MEKSNDRKLRQSVVDFAVSAVILAGAFLQLREHMPMVAGSSLSLSIVIVSSLVAVFGLYRIVAGVRLLMVR
ncbi:MAG: hypothetical protein CVV05_13650 [Gammaproteobacteria bacterium HGW-Gammaproteobacteria-1]|jgi:hypothetical protein|nr:MAG: hypothetical protein CVV05_13650 [Gammaproteobacteria bacterium HGW-Gammaproteobacteria-1]